MKDAETLKSLLAKMYEEEENVLITKGNDYSDATGQNRLANFERIAERYYIKFKCSCGAIHRVKIPPAVVLSIYREKHEDSIKTWICEGEVQSEAIEGRILDDRNYLALLRLMIEDTNE